MKMEICFVEKGDYWHTTFLHFCKKFIKQMVDKGTQANGKYKITIIAEKVKRNDRLICEGTNNRNYFVRNGYLYNAERGKKGLKKSTLRKLGLVEESFMKEEPMKQRISRKDLLPKKFYLIKELEKGKN